MKILAQFYRFTFQAFFNIVFNLFWYIKIVFSGKFLIVKKEKKIILASIKNYKDVESIYKKFSYMYDGILKGESIFAKWPTWTSTIDVLIYREFKGNCQDADYFARWLLRRIDLKGKRIIFVPTKIKYLDKVHYFTVFNKKVFSDGKILTIKNYVKNLANGKKYILIGS